ncbi:MAG: hypothetical protein ACRYG2_05115, partial [Janthinobacterium lividum]
STRHDVDSTNGQPTRRLSTETKSAVKTTELVVFVLAVLAVIITANFYDGDAGSTGGDPFGATTAIRYVVYLTIGYLVSRGLAKSGSHENYSA